MFTFTWSNTIVAIIITFIIKKLVLGTFFESKATGEWLKEKTKLKKWLESGATSKHPRTKKLQENEKKARKKMKKADIFYFLKFFKKK